MDTETIKQFVAEQAESGDFRDGFRSVIVEPEQARKALKDHNAPGIAGVLEFLVMEDERYWREERGQVRAAAKDFLDQYRGELIEALE